MYGTLTITLEVREVTTTPDRPKRIARRVVNRQYQINEEQARHMYKRFRAINPELKNAGVWAEWAPSPVIINADEL